MDSLRWNRIVHHQWKSVSLMLLILFVYRWQFSLKPSIHSSMVFVRCTFKCFVCVWDCLLNRLVAEVALTHMGTIQCHGQLHNARILCIAANCV